MKVVRMDQVGTEPVEGQLFFGNPVRRLALFSPEESQHLSFTVLSFSAGSQNAFHIHSHDQVVVITEGKCLVATEQTEQTAAVGDVVLFPAGENHMHGPVGQAPLTFVSITPKGTVTTVTER
jgi:quercetin dioxygenase-like cupin family protein